MKGETQNTTEKAIAFSSQSRGRADYGWLKTNYTFSFAQYFNPDRIHFGALRVLNDDVVAPDKGFDTHPHDNMEIITIPLSGTLRHKDSMGHVEDIRPDEVQVMSAGTGIFHSEYNPSKTEAVALFQIWIMPEKRNVKPVYGQRKFERYGAQNQWQVLVGPNGSDGDFLKINQQARLSRVFITKGTTIDYMPQLGAYGTFMMVVEGSVAVDGYKLGARDAVGIYNNGEVTVTAHEDSYVINIEVPDAPLK